MTTEQQQIQAYVAHLIEQGNITILQRNSRSLTPKWKRLLQGGLEHVLSAAPFVALGFVGMWLTRVIIEWLIDGGWADIIGGFIVEGLGL